MYLTYEMCVCVCVCVFVRWQPYSIRVTVAITDIAAQTGNQDFFVTVMPRNDVPILSGCSLCRSNLVNYLPEARSFRVADLANTSQVRHSALLIKLTTSSSFLCDCSVRSKLVLTIRVVLLVFIVLHSTCWRCPFDL